MNNDDNEVTFEEKIDIIGDMLDSIEKKVDRIMKCSFAMYDETIRILDRIETQKLDQREKELKEKKENIETDLDFVIYDRESNSSWINDKYRKNEEWKSED